MVQTNATSMFLFRKPHQVVCSSVQYSTQLMSKDDNLILQMVMRRGTQRREKETQRRKKGTQRWKKGTQRRKKGTQRRKKKFYEIKQNGNNNFRCATRRKNHNIRNPTRKRIHTTGI